MGLRFWEWAYDVGAAAVESFNFFEGLFWIAASAYVIRKTVHGRIGPRPGAIGAALLFLFGISDFVEITTGAWWRPWWLLVWKGVCLFGLIGLYVAHRLEQRRAFR